MESKEKKHLLDPQQAIDPGSSEGPSGRETPLTISSSDGTLVDNYDRESLDAQEDDGSEEYHSDDSEGVNRWVINEQSKPRKISEKKRADNAIFENWLEENQRRLARSSNSTVENTDDQRPWIDGTNRKIIEKAREYQIELYERAKQQNTIAVLDTGSGKTLIAALLLRWVIEQELGDRAKGESKRIAFFVVDKVALVFQQYAVLDCNLDHPMEKLCGELVGSQRSKAYWDKILDENMAVVCTAEILNQCLHHSFLRMNQINLLIFDEAHHAKKDHPYARIIKDFYAKEEETARRPRILGMTASPVDSKCEPLQAAAELEGLLHSRIATTDDPTAAQNTIQEEWVQYAPLVRPFRTALHTQLSHIVGDHELFQKPFASAAKISAHLGAWCGDRFWQLYFEQEDELKIETKTERSLLRGFANNDILDGRLEEVRASRDILEQCLLGDVQLNSVYLSGKVLLLVDLLQKYFGNANRSARCLVFVQERNTAVLLADLFQQPSVRIPGLKVGVLVGGGRTDGGPGRRVSYRDQALAILQFRKGELNCLFATSVAEEGLDIPDCNTVIRFDVESTLIQYIQSRGRARQKNSIYIHMIEQGNRDHKKRAVENEVQERMLRRLCSALPEDRKLTGNDFKMEYFLKKERSQRIYTIPSTGAKLTYKQSLVCLATFAASLNQTADIYLTPDYVVVPVGGGFQCEVTMPAGSPVKLAVGKVHSSKAVAKCSAAFEMCLKLIKGRYLNEYLQPTFAKRIHAMRNARLAVSSKKRSEYDMHIRPKFWSTLGQPTALYVTALTLASPNAPGHSSVPLLLLSRKPLPPLSSFPLFFGKGVSSDINCFHISQPLNVDEGALDGLTKFTLKVFQDIFSKEYEPEDAAAKLPYFLAPSLHNHGWFSFAAEGDVDSLVDWTVVEHVQSTDAVEYKYEDEPDEFFKEKFITDPWDGSRKFYLRCRRYDLKPHDPVPEGVVASGPRWRSCEDQDILNYSLSMWSASRARFVSRGDQPVVEAELLSVRRNLLDSTIGEEDLAPKQCFLVLEPLKISPLPVDVVAMAYNLPAIIHRIDSNLIALDACSMLDLSIHPSLALEALTKDSDNTDEHDTEQVNIQRGMGSNYERLEFLGDCFLKMATTISVYTLIPENNEADSHTERMLLICNQNLFNNALEVNTQEYVRSKSFNRRTWYPSNLELRRGKGAITTGKHTLSDKTIADVCEALIGAAYLTMRDQENPLDMAVKAVTVMVKDKKHPMTKYSDYYAAYKKPDWQCGQPTSPQLDMAKKFAVRMGYTFTHPPLLRCAFLHPTYSSISFERIPSYQRLEFLGDALLDMACVDYLFTKFPTKDPQWLTEHKMAMVSNQFLGCLSVSVGFHKAILHMSAPIQRDTQRYVEEITLALETAQEDAVREGKPASAYARDYWLHCANPPKCLPDVVAASNAVVFVDSGYHYSTVQAFFDTHVQPYFTDMSIYDTFANKHPITLLGHLMQNKFLCTDWRVLAHDMARTSVAEELAGLASATDDGATIKVACCVMVHGAVFADAVSTSGRYGKIAAAKSALAVLKTMSRDEFRAKHGCRCHSGKGDSLAAVSTEEHGTAI